jgi:hypothetical protein
MKNLLKPLSLALFVAATLLMQNACNRTSPSSNPPTQNAYTQTSPPFDTIFATGPSSSFRKAIGGPASEEDSSLIQTSDGGYAIAGDTSSFGAGQADIYVVKLDANGNLQWTKTIGGPASEEGSSLIQTSDGGYAIAGSTKSFGAGGDDVYVVKLDAKGNLQWTKTIGGPKGDYGNSLIQTSDGGYAIAGATKSFGAGAWDVYVVKLDAHGNLQWTKTIGGPKDDRGSSLIQTSDGGYAIAGKTESFGAGYTDVYVIKLDANGNLQWTKTIGGEGLDDGSSIIQTSDGGYAIAGSASFGAENYEEVCVFYDVYVVKLDANGNLQWTKTIDQEGSEWGYSLIQTSDGGYAIAGTYSLLHGGIHPFDVYVVKLDANGNLQWTKTIGGEHHHDSGSSLIQTSDGGYAIAGYTYSFGAGDYDVYVVKLDAKGNLQWTKTIGGKSADGGSSIIQTSDGGYVIAGDTKSFGAGETDVCVVKLDKNGNACCAVSRTSQVGTGGRLGSSPTPSIGSGGTLTSPTSGIGLGGTLTNQCP